MRHDSYSPPVYPDAPARGLFPLPALPFPSPPPARARSDAGPPSLPPPVLNRLLQRLLLPVRAQHSRQRLLHHRPQPHRAQDQARDHRVGLPRRQVLLVRVPPVRADATRARAEVPRDLHDGADERPAPGDARAVKHDDDPAPLSDREGSLGPIECIKLSFIPCGGYFPRGGRERRSRDARVRPGPARRARRARRSRGRTEVFSNRRKCEGTGTSSSSAASALELTLN